MRARSLTILGVTALLASAAAVTGFAATLGVDSGTIDTFSSDQAGTTTTTTAQGDTTAPTRTALEMFDIDADGKVDQVKVTFDETLANYTADTTPWTLAGVPSGGTLSEVSVSGSVATLTITEGNGAPDTAVGTFTVALAQHADGIRDADGNKSSFTATAPTDKAGPVPISLTMADSGAGGSVVGSPNRGDTQTIVFSEALSADSVCPGQTTSFMLKENSDMLVATLTDGTPEKLTFSSNSACDSSLEVGSITLGTAEYLPTGSRTFSGDGNNRTEVTWSATTRHLVLKLGDRSTGTAPTVNPSRTATYNPSTHMTDAVGNEAVGSVTYTGVQF